MEAVFKWYGSSIWRVISGPHNLLIFLVKSLISFWELIVVLTVSSEFFYRIIHYWLISLMSLDLSNEII